MLASNQMVNGIEGDEIVLRMGLYDEFVGGSEQHRCREIGEGEGDRAPEIDIARVPEEAYSGIGLVLDRHRHLLRTEWHETMREGLLLIFLFFCYFFFGRECNAMQEEGKKPRTE